ncbi:TrbI/VirB10 family protein [Parerythrobacter jejuensis]|uniref:Type VI secretion protein n=1 Tax=Parerythrobacter jejuensis TaxID=795812 RepID=A0A845ANR1_9SPHN|nr:TrbI/VirB10 family protein [Parerythrobacter jejuensis]MXP31920.1 type VI secretion protein [Parerythrobacter jejuensis]
MRLPEKKKGDSGPANDGDPRDGESAEIIDLASRTGYPAVAQKNGKSDAMGLVAGIAIVAALGAVTLWSMNSARVAPPPSVGNAQNAAPPPVLAQAPQQATAPAAVAASRPDPAPAPVLAANPNIVAGPSSNPNAAPSLVFDAGALGAPVTAPGGAAPAVAAPAGGMTTGNSANDFASRIGGVGGATASAQPMANPATTVTQGTLIPAILETAIDTDVPGFVRAVVSQDVRSFDGKNILVPRSSRLIGQYQSGVQGGQKRAYVIWTRLIRPDGASVNLQSPAIGFDGTTGLEGKVNSRFFQRFGSAMLLSVVGGLSAIGTGGASVVIGGGGQAAAAAAVQQDSQVGPTIRVRQGEPIRVFTARDLDFSGV